MREFHIYFLSIVLCSSLFSAQAQESTSAPFVRVGGEVLNPLNLSRNDLMKMKAVNANMKDRSGKDHLYRGVALQEILDKAGVTLNKQLRGKNLSKYLLIKCADGYELVFSLAEIDSSFTERVVTLAYESDGKPLPDSVGPFRLIVPGDKKPARSGFQVVELLIKFARE